MNRRGKASWMRVAYLVVALAALANGGCLLVAAGAAAGGATGYAYYKGNVCRVYAAGLDDVLAATRTSLAELGMPVLTEQREPSDAYVDSRTGDGDKVRIHLDVQTSAFPAEGPLTRVGVRVATFGDYPVSERILDQISRHLVPAVPGQPPSPAPPVLGTPQIVPASTLPQSAPPPLLPAEPEPVTRK